MVVQSEELEFWAYVDKVFAEVADELGEVEDNLWWLQRPSVATHRKLVLCVLHPNAATVREL